MNTQIEASPVLNSSPASPYPKALQHKEPSKEPASAQTDLNKAQAQAQAELGMALQQVGKIAQAAQAYLKAVELNPAWAEMNAMLAIALQSIGEHDQAIVAYRKALALNPKDAQSHSNLGVLLQTLGRSQEAIEFLNKAVEIDPQFAEAYANLGIIYQAQGQVDKAVQMLQKALDIRPNYAQAHANLGVCYQQQGQWADAAASLQVATVLQPDYAVAYQALGVVLYQLKQPAQAACACRSAINLGIESSDVYLVLGVALQDVGSSDEAIAAYHRAITINPLCADAYSNLGVVYLEKSNIEQAVKALRKALALQPSHLHASSNLAIALHEQGQDEEAALYFEKALALHPQDADVHSNFAMVRIHQGRIDEAVALLDQSAALNQNHAKPLGNAFEMPVYRIKHDVEQMRLLKQRQLLPKAFEDYADFLESAHKDCATFSQTDKLPIADHQVARIASSYNRLVYRPRTADVSRPYLNPALDVAKIEQQYFNSKPEVVWIDDFLAPATWQAVRNFCLEATIWKKEYPNGYLGATLKDGFASPLLLQIAEDLRKMFPRIFGTHLLEQAWAFKYDSTMRGINVHADFASVNINFWITPDAACLNPDNGGLIVWDVESPKDWSFQSYNADEAQIRRFLSQSGAKAIRIPYRANRCVLFNSTLFHETDRFEFNDAYADRRINVTLLYGKGLRMR
jgi:tetratricopeptide (TPR) repeat protein